MKSRNILIFNTFLIFALISSGLLFAQEKKIDKKDLPKAVLNTFQKSYPDAEIKGTSIEKENGKIYYEIESMEGTQRRDLLYTKAGKLTEIEETLTSTDIPEIVKNSVMSRYPNGEINRAEKVTSGKTISYELVVKNGIQKHEVVIDPKGNIKKTAIMKKENEGKEAKENEKEDND